MSSLRERVKNDSWMYRLGLTASGVLALAGHLDMGLAILFVNYWGWRSTWESKR